MPPKIVSRIARTIQPPSMEICKVGAARCRIATTLYVQINPKTAPTATILVIVLLVLMMLRWGFVLLQVWNSGKFHRPTPTHLHMEDRR